MNPDLNSSLALDFLNTLKTVKKTFLSKILTFYHKITYYCGKIYLLAKRILLTTFFNKTMIKKSKKTPGDSNPLPLGRKKSALHNYAIGA